MRAVVYQKPFSVNIENVPDPAIEHPSDAIVKVTSSAICGSDLHMYEGRTLAQAGMVFGHENMGIVAEVGPGVSTLKPGDRVVMPFNVACGFCANCQRGYTGFCLTVNPGFAGGAYGYVAMGPYRGGQAEYLRVPFADFNALKLPPGSEFEDDFVLLADIFPTGYHAAELASVSPGETVAVFGGGPVGLMAAYSALIRGAAQVFVVEKVPERIELIRQMGATPVDFSGGDPVEQILAATEGQGTDKSIDAVGYQAHPHGAHGEQVSEEPARVLNDLIRVTKPTGQLGVVGLYLPQDPGGVSEAAKKGQLLIEFGKFFEKGLSLGSGQANVKRYNRQLRDLIIAGKAKPSFLVSHRLPLSQAPEGYRIFDQKTAGCTKVILKPELA
jgi:glutathione-independent formaldehyde dehydrogenase